MIRRYWHDVDFWRWFWHERVRGEVKAMLAAVVLAGLLGGGWIAADRLTSASAARVTGTGGYFTFETTVERLVTVRQSGRVVRKLVPVVRKVFLKPRTSFETTTDVRTNVVTLAGGVRTVRNRVVVHVPVVSTKVITVNGRTKTLVTTRLLPTTAIQTQTTTLTRVQTQVQVQVATQTQTQSQTQTNTVTTTQTVTQPVTTKHTVTQTVTVTTTLTATVPVTVVLPVTETVTQESTVTVTTS
jgi:hypothetical protein